MYQLKNYLLSMQSHWMINQATYDAVQETIPIVAKYHAEGGTEKNGKDTSACYGQENISRGL